ncbi:hypothetical protein RB623_24245 [Mesorhizobium sp. LHD-90]|uniref:hypothetical protein n=1 Tax=Mesorhizobium sp. LHD-90 TaxID=3071414 RepID=UPI0027E0BA3E|nr:hypothetical protein [Mesorhizobium sp. LHD-90]MDQ6437176.1 hypothetical protein [Mesorhizobium sp. LHD-90]
MPTARVTQDEYEFWADNCEAKLRDMIEEAADKLPLYRVRDLVTRLRSELDMIEMDVCEAAT